jgi:peptidyl-prolyl cis-trans isomerase B (cyclophilin B)
MRAMSRIRIIAASAALLLTVGLLGGCAGSSSSTGTPAGDAGAQAPKAATGDTAGHVGTYKVAGTERVVVSTDRGAFTLELNAAKAPNTVSSFLELVASGFYDGIRVHRVVPGFVMQLGDPQTKGLSARQVQDVIARQQSGPLASDPPIGAGGPGWTMKAEISDLVHDRGVIAMARSQAMDSAGSQIYITLAPAHDLDGQYTVFGRVLSGMDVVDKLQVGDLIKSAKIVTGN